MFRRADYRTKVTTPKTVLDSSAEVDGSRETKPDRSGKEQNCFGKEIRELRFQNRALFESV
jgi:hypothetical protein